MWCVSFSSSALTDTFYTEAPSSVVARALCEAMLIGLGIFDYRIKSVRRVNGG